MIYALLKWITGIALHWFYRDIRVVDREQIPRDGPLLIAVNHQNALVDSLIAGWVVPRKIAMTAKATLLDNPLIALLFKALNVVPLRRVSDEVRSSDGGVVNRDRNAEAFREILRLLANREAVLIFPEGKSHNEAGLEPLKSGLARIALQARDELGIRNVKILPLGLVFEDKGTPGTVVGARIGEAIEMDRWSGTDATTLTEEIAVRLRRVSESAGLPHEVEHVVQTQESVAHKYLVGIAAWWGRTTHSLPIRIARSMALNRSTNADEPAMLTIMFGIGLVLVTYAIHLTIVGIVARSLLLTSVYLLSLVNGAYWAAFEQHPRRY